MSVVIFAAMFLLGSGSDAAFGDGHGGPAACSTNANKGGMAETSVNPNDSASGSFSFTFTAPEGLVVDGICIKQAAAKVANSSFRLAGTATF
jgi:hypothetical protein